jgi:hypothetical protein
MTSLSNCRPQGDLHRKRTHLIFAGHYLIVGGVLCEPVRKLHA